MSLERRIRGLALWVGSGMIGAAALVQAAPAGACSCGIPFQNELRTGDGQVPANAGVPWWLAERQSAAPLESLVTIERIEGGQQIPVPAAVERFEDIYVIRPASGWSAGERYRISVDTGLEGAADQRLRTAEVEITPALEATKPLDMSMSIAQRRRLQLIDNGGSCSSERDAAVVELSAGAPEGMSAFPLGILYFSTHVDGAPWRPSSSLCESIQPGTSWTGPHSDRLVAPCDGSTREGASLSEGQHTVQMLARLPGTDVTFQTIEQLIELRCDTSALDPGDDEDEAAIPSETDTPYAAAPARNPVVIGEPAEGCSLSGAPARGPAFGITSLLAALMLGWSRRRQRALPLRDPAARAE